MPFLAQEHVPIPNKDILSWIYDEPKFDHNLPIYVDASDPSNSISASEAKTLIRQLIAGFKYAGLEKDDTVLLHSFNNIYYPILVLGIIGCGVIFTGTNPSYTAHELTHAFRSCKAKLLICDPDLLADSIISTAKAHGLCSSKILALDSTSPFNPAERSSFLGYKSWRTLLAHGESDWIRFNSEEMSRNTTALLFFSSGTTGLPKLTQLSHYNMVAQHTLAFEHRPRPYTLRRLIALPMFHAATAPSTHISPLRSGHPQIIMRRYEPGTFFDMIEKHAITDLTLVPPQVISLLVYPIPSSKKKKKLASVKLAYGGAAPLDPITQNRFQILLPKGTPFTQVFGMTETSCFASLLYYPEHDTTGSLGCFMPNIDVKLLDDTGAEIIAYNKPGELAIRGPTVTRGYVGIPRERDFDVDGYFRTGDVMYCNAATKLWYIVDRKKELIKVRGFQVAPAELEGVVLEHPDVVDVAVIGVLNRTKSDEMPRAYVVRKKGVGLTEREVKGWVEEKLARYKRLEGGVRFVDAIPKSASGKILKRVLRDEVRVEERSAKL